MNKFSVLLFFSVLFLSSCKSFQPTTDFKEKPHWVQSRPQSSNYYIGISSASKKGFSPDSYTATAKQNALNDLSSEISVTIESSSVLNSIQTNNSFSQQFVNDIKTSNALYLEGYELVDSYEDADNYWVYYQLSKSDYQQWKAQKKQQAILSAKNKYLQAEKMLNEQLHYNAFQFYAEALALISPYLNESTMCEIENQQIDLGNTIYNAIVDFLNNAKIPISSYDITVKNGVDVKSDDFCFYVKDKSGRGMDNIPIKVDFTGQGLMKSSEKTGNNGRICCSLQKLKSSNLQETLSLSIDVTALSRVVTDHLVRRIIKSIPVSKTELRILFQKPSLQILSEEKVLNVLQSEDVLKSHVTNNLSNSFEISEIYPSDFILLIKCNTQSKEKYNNQYYVELDCVFTLNDSFGNQIYRKRIKQEFSGKDIDEASKKGYSEVVKIFDRSIKREIENYMGKG